MSTSESPSEDPLQQHVKELEHLSLVALDAISLLNQTLESSDNHPSTGLEHAAGKIKAMRAALRVVQSKSAETVAELKAEVDVAEDE